MTNCTCDKSVLTYFYGNGNSGSRSTIINDIRKWSAFNQSRLFDKSKFKQHRIIRGAHKIGKTRTVEHALNGLSPQYLSINDKTAIKDLNQFVIVLRDFFFNRNNNRITDEYRNSIDKKVNEILKSNKNKTNEKLLLILELIKELKKFDPQISIIIVYESKSQLETELYSFLIDNIEIQFIFKIKVSETEIYTEDDPLSFEKLYSVAHQLDLKPLTTEESKKMIRGEHDENDGQSCGITKEKYSKLFSENINLEDLIIDIVGCHPYLICELCSKIIDEINSIPNQIEKDIDLFLAKLIRKDKKKYDTFFKNFFENIKLYESNLFDSYKNWILKDSKPEDDDFVDDMNMFGMSFRQGSEIKIPLLFIEYILENTVKKFGINNLEFRRTTMKKETMLKSIKYVLSTIEKIPGVGVITAPINEAINQGLDDLKNQELFNSIELFLNNKNEITVEHLKSMEKNLEDLKDILIDTKDKLGLDIQSIQMHKDDDEMSDEIDFYKIKLNNSNIMKIEKRFKEEVTKNLLNNFSDDKAARNFYLDFKNSLENENCAHLIGGASINENNDTNEIIFKKILNKYDKLKNNKEKLQYISALYKQQEINVTKSWLEFLGYMNNI